MQSHPALSLALAKPSAAACAGISITRSWDHGMRISLGARPSVGSLLELLASDVLASQVHHPLSRLVQTDALTSNREQYLGTGLKNVNGFSAPSYEKSCNRPSFLGSCVYAQLRETLAWRYKSISPLRSNINGLLQRHCPPDEKGGQKDLRKCS